MGFDPSKVQRGAARVAEQRIRAAQEAGAFNGLSGAGKPIADLDRPFDELWWVRNWVRREGVSGKQLHHELKDARSQRGDDGPAR